MTRAAVYSIVNSVNGKVYVGSSIRVTKRLSVHRWRLERRQHDNFGLQKSWDKHGASAFRFDILEVVEDETVLLQREQFWIDRLKAANSRRGYNLCPVAGTRQGSRQPASVSIKLRQVHSGKPKTAEHKAKIAASMKGRVKSPETIAKIRAAALRQMSDPHRRAMASVYAKMTRKI